MCHEMQKTCCYPSFFKNEIPTTVHFVATVNFVYGQQPGKSLKTFFSDLEKSWNLKKANHIISKYLYGKITEKIFFIARILFKTVTVIAIVISSVITMVITLVISCVITIVITCENGPPKLSYMKFFFTPCCGESWRVGQNIYEKKNFPGLTLCGLL